jgi:hypothetical protein
MYVYTRAQALSSSREPACRGKISLQGFSGLYHTFARSGKMQQFMSMIPEMSDAIDKLLRRNIAASIFCILLVALLISAGCKSRSTNIHENSSSGLTIAAAANLTDAFAEIGPRFTSRTGIQVVFSFGATADLAKQIENGVPLIFSPPPIPSM